MASIEYIQKRIAGKEKEIEKLTKKLERIKKAEATGWEVNPYYYNERDLKSTEKDLNAAKVQLEKLTTDLETATEKANSRNVKAIVDFLEQWKEKVRKFYNKQFPVYLKAREQFWKEEKELNWFCKKGKERKEAYEQYNRLTREFQASWGYMEQYVDIDTFNTEKFEKDIKNEADRKYDNIIERTNEITGTITDATGLEIGESGELDGYVIGEKGKAHVHTIGAGGWNIQCYHFRVLVHKVNTKGAA